MGDRGGSQSFGPGVYARMTGLTISQLRRYDRLGHLPPDEVDAAGRRWYRRRQLDRGRLLAGLVASGMPVAAAARAAADRDGAAIRAHLDRVDAALTAVHAAMPAPAGRPLLRREPHEVRVLLPFPPIQGPDVPDALTLALRTRRALAEDLGVGVEDLPRHTRPERGFPQGPLVLLAHPVPLMAPLGGPARLAGCGLPWDASAREAPPQGWDEVVLPQEPWTVAALTEAERGGDPVTLGAAVDEVVAVLTGVEPHSWSTVAIAYEADLVGASLTIACRPIFGLG